MKYISNFFAKRIKTELPTPLGRWNINYCDKKLNNKIDLSNEDHCGPCGQYVIAKLDTTNKNKNINIDVCNKNDKNDKNIKPL